MSVSAKHGPTTASNLAATIEAKRQDDGYNGWTYYSRVSAEHRYVCMAVPKVASTTVKRALHEFEGLPTAPSSRELHRQGDHLALSTFTSEEIATMLTSQDWFRFSFIRNPYHRLFSAWKSKIASTWDEQYDWLRDLIRDACCYPDRRPDGSGPVVTFRDFVHFVRESDDPKVSRDGHWDLQTSVLLYDVIRYDMLGRFERFPDEFVTALSRLNAPQQVIDLAKRVTNPSPQITLAAAYDRSLADLVHQMYERDFETFGYRRDSWLFDHA